jgi:hypothetical protein
MDDQYKSSATGCFTGVGIQSDKLLDSPTSVQNKAQFAVLQNVINLLNIFVF